MLCVKCPFESTASRLHDCGRNTYNIMKIRGAFEYAYYALLRALRVGRREQKRKSLLGLLVGMRGEMLMMRTFEEERATVERYDAKSRYKAEYELKSLQSSQPGIVKVSDGLQVETWTPGQNAMPMLVKSKSVPNLLSLSASKTTTSKTSTPRISKLSVSSLNVETRRCRYGSRCLRRETCKFVHDGDATKSAPGTPTNVQFGSAFDFLPELSSDSGGSSCSDESDGMDSMESSDDDYGEMTQFQKEHLFQKNSVKSSSGMDVFDSTKGVKRKRNLFDSVRDNELERNPFLTGNSKQQQKGNLNGKFNGNINGKTKLTNTSPPKRRKIDSDPYRGCFADDFEDDEEMEHRPKRNTLCIYYQRGNCRRGNSCHFVHKVHGSRSHDPFDSDDSDDIRNELTEFAEENDFDELMDALSGPLENNDLREAYDSVRRSVCKQHMNGKCRRGSSCQFIHL